MSSRSEIVTPRGDTLHVTVRASRRAGRRPTVVLCHGFKGFAEWCFMPHLAELLSERGFTTVQFNFSGAGMRPGDERVTDLEAFRTAAFSRDLEELLFLTGRLETLGEGTIDPDRLGMFGHSRGGGIAALAAAEDSLAQRLRALVTWNAVSTFDRSSPEEKAAWRAEGELIVVNGRTGQRLSVGVEVLEDLEANRERLDILAAAGRIRAPWLLVHGGDDETVPVDEGRRLAREAVDSATLLEIENGSHTLGARHPFAGPTRELIEAINATQTWFRRHLGSESP